MADGELLTTSEVARLLGVNRRTVTRWARHGKISAVWTLGGDRRFLRSEVERALEAGADDRDSHRDG
jgi:excisionase family DNA binding protein